MPDSSPTHALGRRERQIMDIVYRLGKASVTDVRNELPDPPTYSAVRGMLRLLETKGFLTHQDDGLRYLYSATVKQKQARKSALRHMVRTFFAGSAADAAASLLELSDRELSADDITRLTRLIGKARTEGR
jgi:BlaI family transcriptional regulator, penicillinase repressor